jgi:hypothetical protein
MTRSKPQVITGRTIGIVLAFIICQLSFVISAHAVVRIEPAVLDIQSLPREAPYFTVQVVNDTAQRVVYYPLVGEFDARTGMVRTPGSPYEADRLVSANLEINREEISVAPGASVSLTGKLNISSKLPPGMYHAVIALVSEFPQGGQEGLRLDPAIPRVLMNVAVQSDAKERLNLVTFNPLKKLFIKPPVKLLAKLENGGNVPLSPKVETRIFDRTDMEVGVVQSDVPQGAVPDGKSVFVPVNWESGGGFGRYRALISVSYGSGVTGQVLTATANFWVFPLWFLAVLAVVLLVLSYGAARIIVRRVHHHHDA